MVPTDDPVIRILSVSHTYPARKRAAARRALDDVSFDVPRRSIVGLLGPNGGGKSTLMRILATLLRPTQGTASILGYDVLDQAAAVRARIGVLFQSPSIDKRLTVRENLVHQGHLYGLRGTPLAQRIDTMLDRLQLGEHGGVITERLSGGLQRRVEIAKSLLHLPELLLLDEPSTGLDPAVRRDLWAFLTSLREEMGMTILVTTHIMEEAEHCDRLVMIDRGRVITYGTPDALRAGIGGDVIAVSGADPSAIAATIEERFGLRPVSVNGSVRVEVERGHEMVPRIVEALGSAVRSVTVSKPSLEDVFVHFVGHRFEGDEVREEAAV